MKQPSMMWRRCIGLAFLGLPGYGNLYVIMDASLL